LVCPFKRKLDDVGNMELYIFSNNPSTAATFTSIQMLVVVLNLPDQVIFDGYIMIRAFPQPTKLALNHT